MKIITGLIIAVLLAMLPGVSMEGNAEKFFNQETLKASIDDPSEEIVWTLENIPNITEAVEWEKMTDAELTDVINHSTDQQIALFLYGLTEEQFYEVIERETPLKYPVYQFTELEEQENGDTGNCCQKREILAEYYYEYALQSMVSLLSWSNSTGNYEGSASGHFYFKIEQEGEILTNLTIKVDQIKAGGSTVGKYTISGTYGTWQTTSVTSEKEKGTWAGIVMEGSYKKPAHYYTMWESMNKGLGRYDPWDSGYEEYTLDCTHTALDTEDTVRLQVNGCNIGLVSGYESYHATGKIILLRYQNALKIDPNGGIYEGRQEPYLLAVKECGEQTEILEPVREGYQFMGWTVKQEEGAAGSLCGSVFIHCNSGAKFSTVTDVYSGTTSITTLTANWEQYQSVLKVDPNGGIWRGSGLISELEMFSGASERIEDPEAPVAGKIILYYHDTDQTVLEKIINKKFNRWTKSGGGSFLNTTKLFIADNSDAVLKAGYMDDYFQLPVLTKEHYTHVGWDADPNAYYPEYSPGDSLSVNGTMVLHAIWRAEMGLSAHIERVPAPHDPVFRNGEMGILKINLTGFVNLVEITFPYEVSRYDESLSVSIPLVPKQSEELERAFYIPLDSAGGEYRVKVTAYNEERNFLTVYPSFSIRGSVLDDFRTRIR